MTGGWAAEMCARSKWLASDISNVNFHFHCGDTFASRGQKMIYWGPLKPLEHLLLRTMLVPLGRTLPRVSITTSIGIT